MGLTLYAGSLSLALFAGMLVLMEIGRRAGMRRQAKDPELAKAGFGAIEGGVLALPVFSLSLHFPEPARGSTHGGISLSRRRTPLAPLISD
jgi:hypothetical protein